MGGQFPCIDIYIPLAHVDARGNIKPENMAHILISVKNRFGTSNDSLSKDSLDTETVLGISTAKGEYIKPKSRSNLLLALQTLLFIRRRDKPNSVDAHCKDWIKATKRNPYIAFVMSIGSGVVEGERRFIAEEQVFKVRDPIND
jgi:hypothetical protein